MVGLFLWRIFLNFPLKSLGGKGSRGKLAMRPRTTSSRTSEQSVSLSVMSLTARSPKDVSDGREPTAISLILPSETVPVSPSFGLNVLFNLSPLSLAGAGPCGDAAYAVCWCALTSALVRAVQQVTVTFMNWAGIGLLIQPLLFSVKGKKGKRQRREGQSHNSGREEGGRKRPLWQQQHPRLLYAHEAFLNKYPVFVLESAHHSPNRYDSPLALLIRHKLIKKKKHSKPLEDSWAMTDR